MVSFEAWRGGDRLFVAGAERLGLLLAHEHVSRGDEILLRVVEPPAAADSPRAEGAAIKELLAHLASHPERKVIITARGRPVTAINDPDPSPIRRAPEVSCSFCGKAQAHVAKVIAGPSAYICNECVQLCAAILVEEGLWRE